MHVIGVEQNDKLGQLLYCKNAMAIFCFRVGMEMPFHTTCTSFGIIADALFMSALSGSKRVIEEKLLRDCQPARAIYRKL